MPPRATALAFALLLLAAGTAQAGPYQKKAGEANTTAASVRIASTSMADKTGATAAVPAPAPARTIAAPAIKSSQGDQKQTMMPPDNVASVTTTFADGTFKVWVKGMEGDDDSCGTRKAGESGAEATLAAIVLMNGTTIVAKGPFDKQAMMMPRP